MRPAAKIARGFLLNNKVCQDDCVSGGLPSNKIVGGVKTLASMAVEMVPLKGGRDYIIPQLAGKIPLIYHL